MAIDRTNINYSDSSTETLSTKLYTDDLNSIQVEKSVDTRVTELIKPLPTANLDLVPKPIYDAEVKLNAELNKEITNLNAEIADLTTKLNQKTSDSGSLYVSNDFLKITNANLENNLAAQNNIVSELRTGLSTAIQKSISENAERTGLEAETSGLTAQKTALLKQIDTLNNLVKAAGGSLSSVQSALIDSQRALAEAQTATSQAQARAAAEQSIRIQSELSKTKKKKIICNELYNQGYLPQHIWNADERYGNMMFDKEPKLVLGYMMWAKDVVKFMKEKPKYTKWIYMVVKPWTEHMAYEMRELPNDNFIGKIIHNVGKQYCYYVYNQTMSKRNLAY
jgi:predicted  nucleic acid-binding Zn-ribbon protein